jgi:hypothetical protein
MVGKNQELGLIQSHRKILDDSHLFFPENPNIFDYIEEYLRRIFEFDLPITRPFLHKHKRLCTSATPLKT